MQVHLAGKHVDITPGLRQHIHAKVAKLEELFPKVKKVTVVLSVEKYRHTAEIHFHSEKVEMSAKKTTKDMYASVEEAISALEQQAGKRKDRLHTGNSLRRSAIKVERKVGRREAQKEAAEAPARRPKVVRVKAASLKPMDLEDAVALLEASGDAHILFRDSKGGVQLLFRREGGTYGLTEA